MIKILPVIDGSLDCFQGIIASIAKHYNTDYRLMFSNAWGFEFFQYGKLKKVSIGEKLDTRCGGTNVDFMKDILKDYHGFILENHDDLDINKVKLIVEKEISIGYPVAVYLDSFLCPWNIAYLKHHIDHYILIIGLSKEESSYVCIDPFCTESIEKIKLNALGETIKRCYTFRFENNVQKEFEWKYILKENLNRLMGNEKNLNIFHKIRLFAEELKSMDTKQEKGEVSDYYAVPLLRQIKSLEVSRINYIRVLKCIDELYPETKLLDYEESFIYASSLWSKLLRILMKAMMTLNNQSQLVKASTIAYEIADYEEGLAQKLCVLMK